MKVNDLTEGILRKISPGKYVIFKNDKLISSNLIIYNEKAMRNCPFIKNGISYSLKYFKHYFKDCEIFPRKSIKKPE